MHLPLWSNEQMQIPRALQYSKRSTSTRTSPVRWHTGPLADPCENPSCKLAIKNRFKIQSLVIGVPDCWQCQHSGYSQAHSITGRLSVYPKWYPGQYHNKNARYINLYKLKWDKIKSIIFCTINEKSLTLKKYSALFLSKRLCYLAFGSSMNDHCMFDCWW
jgi:hypothetical protein